MKFICIVNARFAFVLPCLAMVVAGKSQRNQNPLNSQKYWTILQQKNYTAIQNITTPTTFTETSKQFFTVMCGQENTKTRVFAVVENVYCTPFKESVKNCLISTDKKWPTHLATHSTRNTRSGITAAYRSIQREYPRPDWFEQLYIQE